MKRRVVLVLWMTLSLGSRSASAQQSPDELARAELLRQADEARRAGDHAHTLDLAQRAGRIRMTPSVRLMIAQAHQALGHVVDALVLSNQCARDAESDAALNNRERILQACRTLYASLNAHVARVTVTGPDHPPPGLQVRVRGSELHPELWGVSYPVLPGPLRIDASTPDGSSFHRQISVAEGESVAVTVVLTPPSGTPAPTEPSPAPFSPTPATPSPAPAHAPSRLGPWLTLGTGALALTLAGVFYGLRTASLSDRDAATALTSAQCDESAARCDYTESYRLDDEARGFNLATNTSLAIGGAALVSGALWWLLTPGETPHARAPTLSWAVVPRDHGCSVSVGGSL